jgi:hypothetical protein
VINGKQPKAEKAQDVKPEAEQLNS